MSEDGGVLAVAWRRYQLELRKKPLRTKALTAGTLAALSDLIAQKLGPKAPWSWRRTVSVALYGLLWSGPAAHYWQNFIQRLFRGKNDPNVVAAKVVIDNLTFAPVMNLIFMSYMSVVVEGLPWETARRSIQASFPAVQAQGWKLWPIVSFINYTYVPLRLRVLVINVVALFWSIFLNMRSRAAPRLPKSA